MIRPGHVIALSALALLTIGVVMVNSAGLSIAPGRGVTWETIAYSQSTIYMGLALVAMILAARLPVLKLLPGVRDARTWDAGQGPDSARWYELRDSGFVMWPMWVGVGLLIVAMSLVYVPGLGHEVNGSHRWLRVGPGRALSIQPSELAKWGLVLLMAWYAWRVGPMLGRFWRGLVPALAAVGLVAGFVVLEDLGTGVLLGTAAAVVLLAGGARWWQFAMMVPFAAAGAGAAIWHSPYRWERIMTFLNPYAEPEGAGYHVIQSMTAVANGEIWGRGLGNGLQKFGYLPEDQTDFLFSIICEELGIPGAALVVMLYIAMLSAGWIIVRRVQPKVLKLLGVGILTTVGVQAIINIAVVTNVVPTKGIALPLLSSGGTGWILTAGCLGLLVNMDRLATALAGLESAAGQNAAAAAESDNAGSATRTQDQARQTAIETGPAGGSVRHAALASPTPGHD